MTVCVYLVNEADEVETLNTSDSDRLITDADHACTPPQRYSRPTLRLLLTPVSALVKLENQT